MPGDFQCIDPLEAPCENPGDSVAPSRIGAEPASFFHTPAWARVLRDTFAFVPRYLVRGTGDRAGAWLPLMEVGNGLTGRRGVSLPFTDECEPIVANPAEGKALFQAAIDVGHAHGWRSLELRGGRALVGDAPASLRFYGHQLSLTTPLPTLLERCDSAVRRAIRKAEAAGLELELARSPEAMRTFYRLYCQTRQKHGLPPQTYRFFENIQRQVLANGLGLVVLARQRQQPIAGAVFFHWGKQALFKYGASDDAFQHLRGNNLVMWEAIQWYARNGYDALHFGRTSLANEGLRRFKLGWGTAERTIEYFRYDLRRAVFLIDKDQAFGWHNRVFRWMPIPLARLLGTLLYRHWA